MDAEHENILVSLTIDEARALQTILSYSGFIWASRNIDEVTAMMGMKRCEPIVDRLYKKLDDLLAN